MTQVPDGSLRALVADVLTDLDALTVVLVAQMRDTEAPYAAMPVAELTGQVRANLESIVHDLLGDAFTHLDSARRSAARRAEQGVPLASVLHAYRLAITTLWDALVAAAERAGPPAPQDLLGGASTVWGVLDAHSQVVSDVYHRTLVDLARRDAERRLDLLNALFEGRLGDWHVLGGSAESLDLPRRGPYVAVSAESGPVLGEEPHDLQRLFTDRGLRSAWRLRPGHCVGVVAVPDRRTLDRARVLLADGVRGRVGLSEQFSELTEAWDRVQEASLAQRCLPEGGRGVVSLADDPLLSLLAASPALGETVAQQVLGDLLTRPDDERQLLLATLSGWFDADGHSGRAAGALFCHRNTVNNRLRRVEELTGHVLTSPRSVALLYVALHALELGPGQTRRGETAGTRPTRVVG